MRGVRPHLLCDIWFEKLATHCCGKVVLVWLGVQTLDKTLSLTHLVFGAIWFENLASHPLLRRKFEVETGPVPAAFRFSPT